MFFFTSKFHGPSGADWPPRLAEDNHSNESLDRAWFSHKYMCVIEIKYNDDDDDDHDDDDHDGYDDDDDGGDDDDDDGDGEIYSDPARVVSISHPKKEQEPNQKKGPGKPTD